ATVPEGVASGGVSVTTRAGTATGGDFFVPPAPFTPADVEFTGRMAFPGSGSLSIPTPAKGGLTLFDAPAGHRMTVTVTRQTFPDGRLSLYGPDGRLVHASFGITAGRFIDAVRLPLAGTYSLLVEPFTGESGDVDLTLADVPPDPTAEITPGGPPVTMTTSVPGQNAALTFKGTAGQRISMVASAITFADPDAVVTVKNPDGSVLFARSMQNGSFMDTKTLPATGTYSIVIDPYYTDTGSFTMQLFDVPADA